MSFGKILQAIFFCAAHLPACCLLHAQTTQDTSIRLEPITIRETRLENFAAGTKVQSFDSVVLADFQQKNLSDLLMDETGIFIKTYGLGGLALSSFRGGSAYQTATLWNGFNINSCMNGQLDFSLVPAGLANSVKIQYGGTSALWGSGAIGGTVHLSHLPVFNKGVSASAGFEAGSFRTFSERLTIEVSRSKWISGLKFSHNNAKNDFPYRNYFQSGAPVVKQTNAEVRQYSVLSENFFRINKKQKLNLFFWYQHADRNIPPTMLQSGSQSNQKDGSYRVTSEWQFAEKKKQFFVRAAYFDENLTYSDAAYDYFAYSRSQSLIAEAEMRIAFGENHFLDAGINNTFVQAQVSSPGSGEGYPQRQRNQFAVFASYKFTTPNKKYSACISARQELLENNFMPFTFSAGADFRFTKWLSGKVGVARVYRIPTLNDLYWIPGGNPGLESENGFSEDLGLRVSTHTKNQRFTFEFEPAFFNRNIGNWIIWLPSQGYWTPQNIMKVWSRGLEANARLTYQIRGIKFTLSAIATYVLSTNEQSKTANDASVGKQLIYTPEIIVNGKFSIEYCGFTLTYRHSYTGIRYITTDNSDALPAYDIAGIRLAKNLHIQSWTLSVFAAIENLYNEEYQALLSRPMPQRSYCGGIAIQFNKPLLKQ